MGKKKVLVLLMCIPFLLSLFGCSKSHLLDGPGMVNTQVWESFELSRWDSDTTHSFWFTLKNDADCYLLTGQCTDRNGKTYYEEEGIQVPNAEADALRSFNLEALPDRVELLDGDLIPPENGYEVRLTLIFFDGSGLEKTIDSDTSIALYEKLLPYFINN